MFLKRLALLRFRNYSELDVEFQRSVNVFIGENGQGKTNILEAISFLLSGESFRSYETDQLIQNGQTPLAVVKGIVHRQKSNQQVQVRIADGRRGIELNDKKSSRQTLLKNFATVVFSPESLMTVKAGPSERRAFIDEIVLSLRPEKYTLFRDYQRALKTRNKLLKDISDGAPQKEDLLGVLESLNPTFLFLATEVTLERIHGIKQLVPEASRVLRNVLEYQSVDIAVDYVISGQSAVTWDPNQVYDAHRFRLQELARAETDSGQTLIGPHKHDVRFLFQNNDARYFCSQGQQRAIILAFKIAQILLFQQKRGETPVLLLDDVLSELDQVRRHNLLKVLSSLKSQIFMTSTELGVPEEFARSELSVFNVVNGTLKESKG